MLEIIKENVRNLLPELIMYLFDNYGIFIKMLITILFLILKIIIQ